MSGYVALKVSYLVDFVGFPIRGQLVGKHFGENGQKLHENYEVNILGAI